MDKSESNGVKIILGEAHICENFTVENVLKAVKNGIPGLPNYYKEKPGRANNASSYIPTISIAGEREQDFFIEKPEDTKAPSQAKLKNTQTNREILRSDNNGFSILELQNTDDGFLLVDFKDDKSLLKFCKKFKICEG